MRIILLILLIFETYTKIPENDKLILLGKISESNIKLKFKNTIEYDPEKIQEIINSYNFPNNYNFFEDSKMDIKIKNQGLCNCSWSFSSTTSLSYRFYKKGINVDLSPQYPLSCYMKNSSFENYLIDAQLNLVKNGTVTEECLPYISKDGKYLENCPQKCKNGSELIKYYSYKPYSTEKYYSEDNFYDIILLIMDELVKNGPLMAQVDLYQDLIDLINNQEKCINEIYAHNTEEDKLIGKYFLTIVGYGHQENKYYWLVQNSLGNRNCVLTKIEFGQIGIERVAFSEPYIIQESEMKKNIDVSFYNITDTCDLILTNNSLIEQWNDTLEINFRNNNSDIFYYQCNKNNLLNKTEINCFYENANINLKKGIYEFNTWKSIGKNNIFNLDETFNQKKFNFYGYNNLNYLISKNIFISKAGSMIILNNIPNQKNEINIPKIYPNINSNIELSNCKIINSNKDILFNYIYCNLTENEIEYFGDYNKNNYISYTVLCGKKIQTQLNVHKLDLVKYPRFTIKKIIMPNKSYFTKFDKFIIIAKIEGEISYISYQILSFYMFAYFKENNNKEINMLLCSSTNNLFYNDYEFHCNVIIYDSSGEEVEFLPYIFYNEINYPYEIIMESSIKAEKDSSFSSYLKMSLFLFLLIIY